MKYDFDSIIDRSNTGSLKWDKYSGKDILPLWVADMDFTSAPEILKVIHERVDHGVMGYTIPYDEVIDEVLQYLDRVHGLKTQKESLVWLPGIVPALNVACRAFGETGDSIMTTTPVYPPFLTSPNNVGKELITTSFVRDGDNWVFDFDAMEKAVTAHTRMYILCNPQNPLGRVFTKEEIIKVAKFCRKHDLVLCSDEIHCDLILDDDVKHVSTAAIDPEIAEQTITLMAPSKTYNLPGMACSFAVIDNPKIRAAFKRAANGFITEVNALGYAACAAAYKHGEPWRLELIEYLRNNRDYLYNFIEKNLPDIDMTPMKATYLAWMNVKKLGLKNPASHFEDHGIGLSDGGFFGDSDYLRINFACPRSRLEEALERFHKAAKDI